MKKVAKKSKFKQFVEVANPNWGMVFLQFLTQFCHVVFKALGAIFTARITVGVYEGLTTGDFSKAYINIILEFTFVVLRNLFTWLNYLVYNPTFTKVYNNVQGKIIDKTVKAQQSNFVETSKEKISNIIGSNVDTISDFTDKLIIQICKLLQVAISVIIVAQANIWVAIVLLAMSVINFFILKYINYKLAFYKQKQDESKDKIYEEATKIMSSKDLINEFNVKEKYDKQFLDVCSNYTKAYKKRMLFEGFKSSWFYVIYFGMTSLLTVAMVWLVSAGAVDVELYLIVVPYFITVTELLNNFYEITATIANCNVALSRVNTILNFTDEEMSKFGDVVDKFGGNNISFVGVSYNNDDQASPYIGKLNDIDISFCPQSINMIVGGKRSGKRLIFNLLRRKISPDKGVITMDNRNLQDYSAKGYNSNIYYCVARPVFIDESIMENLMIAGKSKTKVIEVCKYLEIFDDISALPQGFNTNINSGLTRGLLFMIGMARALLINCDTLMIYELPNSITEKDKNRIIKMMEKISLEKTIIFFTHDKVHANIAKTIYTIEDGNITNVKINDNPDFSILNANK